MNWRAIGFLPVVTFAFLSSLFIPKNSFAQSDQLVFVSRPVSGTVLDFALSGNNLYVATGQTLDTFNISDPSSPQKINSYEDSRCYFIEIEVADNDIYVAQASIYCRPQNSLYILDVSNPSAPTVVGEPLALEGAGGVEKIIAKSGYLYILKANGGLATYDVTDHDNPTLVNTFVPPENHTNFRDGEIVGEKLFIGDSVEGQIWMMDISDKANPIPEDKIDGLGNFYGLDIDGDFLYLAAGHPGMKIFDISDLNDIKNIGTYDTPDLTFNVTVSGNFAFVSDYENGLMVVDISDKSDTRLVAGYQTGGKIYDIAVHGNLVFARDPNNGLYILRFSGLQGEVVPFLDLPWDYESKGMSFDEAALAINAYFDHEYPLLSTAIQEPVGKRTVLTNFSGDFDTSLEYSSHDGYDYGKKAGTKNGENQLAAASGIATYLGRCGACGNAILIDHGNGYQTRYYHLQKDGLVVAEEGEGVYVEKGQKIGQVGFSGRVIPAGEMGSHIHFMVVQDKNGDGDFNDNIPDGVVDPFGWQSDEPDPWPLYSFNYKDKQRVGNKSTYLWTTPLGKTEGTVTSQNESFDLGKYNILFNLNDDTSYRLEMRNSPNYFTSDLLRLLGSSLFVTLSDEDGNDVTSLEEGFTLSVDFSSNSLDQIDPSTLSIYSSSDGMNWAKEETLIDITTKTASARINHLSYFSLMAERVDTTPPQTDINLLGEEGDEYYFRSVVQIDLSATDLGLGTDYTLYKLDDEDWEQYSHPLMIETEGKHILNYYSVDMDENIEEIGETVFYIDKTTPELNIRYSKDLLNTVVEGVDNLEVAGLAVNNNSIEITDKSGNTTKIAGDFDFDNPADSFVLISIKYGELDPVEFSKNLYDSEYKLYPDGKLISINQSWFVNNGTPSLATTNFRTNIDSTRERIKTGPDVLSDSWIPGLHLLSIYTERGNLKYRYE